MKETLIEPRDEFVVPGDTPAVAVLDLSCSILRWAERRVIGLHLDGKLENREFQNYLNRLSSLCFVLEHMQNQGKGEKKITFTME